MTKIVFMSDTHGLHRHVNTTSGDILIHCGDITMSGELKVLEDFNDWIGEQKFTHKIVVAGNHDITLETNPEFTEKMLTNCTYIKNKFVKVEGLRIWGSPYTPVVMEGFDSPFVFNLPRSDMHKIWNKMGKELDILITHGPPKGILDSTYHGEKVGDGALLQTILSTKPKYHAFGHIHESYGTDSNPDTRFINCSLLDENYKLTNEPIVVNI